MPVSDRLAVRRLAWAAAAVLLFTGLATASCGLFSHSPPPSPSGHNPPFNPSGSGTTTQPPPQIPPLPPSEPARITIPAIGIDAVVIPEGLDATGHLQVPPLNRHNLTGWYRYGPTPGQLGPAVIEGHVDSKAGPSVFYNLGKLSAGATIQVTRQDGSRVIFQVDTVELVSKSAFPTQKVYGALNYSALRLITCGGPFDHTTGHYLDNIIAYAHRIPA